MAADPNAVEQAISRTLRDNLAKIQRSADELNQAVSDLIAACASSRPSNALPSMVRAQTSAASLSATFEVLSRLVTSGLQPSMRLPFEPEILRVPSLEPTVPPVPMMDRFIEPVTEHVAESVVEPVAETFAEHIAEPVTEPIVDPVADTAVVRAADTVKQHEPPHLHLIDESRWTAPTPVEESPAVAEIESSAEPTPISDTQPQFEMPPMTDPVRDLVRDFSPAVEPDFLSEPVPVLVHEVVRAAEQVAASEEKQESVPVEAANVFSLDSLPPEEQELHRRAFRIAKVSMQDIKMLRPEDVRLGRENKDLCFRLRDDIEKAHKEYDRRFQSIQTHPVDYFYDWMVEILAGGDSQALGQYPYPSPVLRR